MVIISVKNALQIGLSKFTNQFTDVPPKTFFAFFYRKKNNYFCPIDNKPLTENDIFPDNFTRREIQNMRKPCPNSSNGCQISISPLEMNTHVLECLFRERTSIECSFRQCGCTFKANTQSEIDAHVQDQMASHLNVSFFFDFLFHRNVLIVLSFNSF